MATITFSCVNTNTGKELYCGIKDAGNYWRLYKELRLFLNRMLNKRWHYHYGNSAPYWQDIYGDEKYGLVRDPDHPESLILGFNIWKAHPLRDDQNRPYIRYRQYGFKTLEYTLTLNKKQYERKNE